MPIHDKREGSSRNAADLKRWQARIFSSVWITYFAYYLCRYNMPIANSRLSETFSWDKAQFGIILTSLTLMYAVGQFVNGQLADRFGTRVIASLGVLGSVIMNLAVFGVLLVAPATRMTSGQALVLISVFWGMNGFLQAMGWSPMVRVMTHWFPTRSRGRVMGWLGTCYQFGGAFSWFLALFLVGQFVQAWGGDWRAVFWVPAILFAGVGLYFFWAIRDAPEDVGLPPVEADDRAELSREGGSDRRLSQNVLRTLKNPYLWVVAGTFFLLDMNRYGFVNWLPDFMEERGRLIGAGGFGFKEVMKRCIHPLAGAAGAVVAGWATDRFFGGRRAPVIAILMLLLGLSTVSFPYIAHDNAWVVIAVVALIGFSTYGPHILMVGHAAQDFGKKSGAAGAAGFIDGMGYIGASLAGWGAGAFIDKWGYDRTFVIFGLAAILGAALVVVIWKAGPETQTTADRLEAD